MHPLPFTTPFNPDEAQAARIIDAMTDPDISLRSIAIENNTTLESLTLFLARPDIQERLDNLHNAIAHRTRLLAANSLPGAVTVLRNMLQAYMWEESKITVHPSDKKAVQQRRIAGESTRRAAALLYRLARFQAGPPVGRAVGRASRPSSRSAEQTSSSHRPTLLPPLDEPEARARRTAGDSQQAPPPSAQQNSPPSTPHPAPDTPSRSPTLEQLPAQIQQLAPTLLNLDEPEAPARPPTPGAQEQPSVSNHPFLHQLPDPNFPDPDNDKDLDQDDLADEEQDLADDAEDDIEDDLQDDQDLFPDIPDAELFEMARLAAPRLHEYLNHTNAADSLTSADTLEAGPAP